MHNDQKERINLTFYMKPSQYQNYESRIHQILQKSFQNHSSTEDITQNM
jgi:hypothetical protein